MKRLFWLVIFAFILSGCSGVSTKPAGEAFAQDEVYQGYPCSPNCDDFQKGFDAAGKQELIDENNCVGNSMAEITGCKAYITEYKIENKTFDELLEDL